MNRSARTLIRILVKVGALSLIGVVIGVLILASGCSDDTKTPTPPPITDTTSPAAIADLAVTSPPGRVVTLIWTAPGDDGEQGQASRYEIRYAATPITAATWDSAAALASPPVPKVAGQEETFNVDGLPDSTWHFAVKTADEIPNWSVLSNVTSATVADVVAPAMVTDLVISATDGHSVTLTWTAPGSDGSTGTATEYDLRYAETPITDDTWDAATRRTEAPTPQAAGAMELFLLDELSPERTYSFALKTADENGNWSPLSNCASGETTADLDPPESIIDLAGCSPGEGSVTLRWTAPGNDGPVGQAVEYDLRYAVDVITETNWEACTRVADPPSPAVSGTGEAFTVSGLAPGQSYYFAIKTADATPAWSSISNVCVATAGTSTLRRLTVASRADEYAYGPAWSPDGTSIAFYSEYHSNRDSDSRIYRMPADCGPSVQLTVGRRIVVDPTWSPDGTKIAFAGLFPGSLVQGLLVIDAVTGGNEVKLVAPGDSLNVAQPSWSPDGTRIAYALATPFDPPRPLTSEIDIVPAAGGTPVLLVGGQSSNTAPAWSPDGTKIAFSSNRSGSYEIWVVPATGGDPVQLTHDSVFARSPSWSPDGTRIAFDLWRTGIGQIWVMATDGSDPRQLTFGASDSFQPAWSPDGHRIVFSTRQHVGTSSNADLWVLEVD